MRLLISKNMFIPVKFVHEDFFEEFRELLKRNNIPYNYNHDNHPTTGVLCKSFRVNAWGEVDTNVELNEADARVFLDTVETHSATRVLYDYIGGGRFNVELKR